MFPVVEVTFIYIDTSFKTYARVDNNYFTMVSEVSLSKEWQCNRHKPVYINAYFAKPFYHLSVFLRAEVVNDDSYFNTLLSFPDQNVDYFFTHIIVGKNIVLHVDVMLCLLERS